MSETKYIFVTGGVVSSVGKGITTASLGRVIKSRVVTGLINAFPLFYERFLCWMLPANELYFEL